MDVGHGNSAKHVHMDADEQQQAVACNISLSLLSLSFLAGSRLSHPLGMSHWDHPGTSVQIQVHARANLAVLAASHYGCAATIRPLVAPADQHAGERSLHFDSEAVSCDRYSIEIEQKTIENMGTERTEVLGDSLIPVINRLQDIFSQVSSPRRPLPAEVAHQHRF